MSGDLTRIAYEDGDVGEAMVRQDGKLVEASAYDEREELMQGNEGLEGHPHLIPPKRGRPVGSKDRVPRKPRKTIEPEDESL